MSSEKAPSSNSPSRSKSTVAHDFKTPLTAIQMTLHLLREQKVGPLNPAQMNIVSQAISDCERLVSITDTHFG